MALTYWIDSRGRRIYSNGDIRDSNGRSVTFSGGNNGYDLYFGTVLFPVTPESIETKISGKNKTYDLINEGEMNILKLPGLTTVSFSILLPAYKYPFARYKNGFKQPSYYLDLLERLKVSKTHFQFILSRYGTGSVRKNLHNTSMTVSLENYTIKESAKEGMDIIVDIELKQYKEYKTKTFEVATPSPTAPIALTPVRPESPESLIEDDVNGGNTPKKKKYKVQIPGMSVVEVWATSEQDAITKACGTTWTGTIYVDDQSKYVENGVISIKPVDKEKIAKTITTGIGLVVAATTDITNNKTKVVEKGTGINPGVTPIKLKN